VAGFKYEQHDDANQLRYTSQHDLSHGTIRSIYVKDGTSDHYRRQPDWTKAMINDVICTFLDQELISYVYYGSSSSSLFGVHHISA